jgi:hypothetical protein
MKVGVHMNDGSFRTYEVDVEPSEGYEKILKLVMKELIGAKRVVALVPKKPLFSFTEKVSA